MIPVARPRAPRETRSWRFEQPPPLDVLGQPRRRPRRDTLPLSMPKPSFPYRRAWRSPVPELVLAALAILAYGETLGFGYAWDDHMLVRLDLRQALELSFQGLHVRPVWYLSYVLTQGLGGSAAFEHLVNLALFVLATVLAYRLALGTLGRPGKAFPVTLVWALLPWNAYPVTWIAQRRCLPRRARRAAGRQPAGQAGGGAGERRSRAPRGLGVGAPRVIACRRHPRAADLRFRKPVLAPRDRPAPALAQGAAGGDGPRRAAGGLRRRRRGDPQGLRPARRPAGDR